MKWRIALAVVVVGLAAVAWLGRSRPAADASAGEIPIATDATSANQPAVGASDKPKNEGLASVVVPSWQNTEIDGDIHFDRSGELIPDLALRDLFDYLLTAIGQLPEAQIVQQLRNIGAARHLSERQLAAVVELFLRYIEYQKAAADLRADSTDFSGLSRVYEQRYQLRRDKLGLRAADGFFADSEAYDRYVLAKLAIDNDKSLSPQERAARLADARSRAPQEVRANEELAEKLDSLAAADAQVRKAGGGAAELRIARERIVGAEAAARLQTLDEEEADWNRRLDAVRAGKRQLDGTAGLSVDDRQRQLDRLIAANFSGPDAVRAKALLELNP